MVVIWLGSIEFLLQKLRCTLYKIERIDDNYENTVKRYGVYYFCIDDLPL